MTIPNKLRLIRFDKPIGTLLLWFPTAWALWLACPTPPHLLTVFYFFIGTFLMRSAGCVMNDIADRHIDSHVKRTRSRPLASGEVSLSQAIVILLILLFLSALIVTQLPSICFYEALFAVFITFLYPFCKRFFEAPQLVLSIAFSMGIPMAYGALGVPMNPSGYLLFALNFFWILAYDTLYAMADRPDDLKIGVKSTAILLGKYWHLGVVLCLLIMSALWLVIALKNHFSALFYMFWSVATGLLIFQNIHLYRTTEPNYTQAFSIQSYYGQLMWIAMIFK
jgi:4-hydroxybenzoate polyprenyltransferase